MTDAILFLLPDVSDLAERETHWWHVADERVVDSGSGTEWLDLAAGDRPRQRIALAPASLVRFAFSEAPPGAATPRQAAAIARVAAVEASLGDPGTLHAVSSAEGDRIATAVVDNGVMLAWLDWARALGADPHHVVPVGAVLPLGEEWIRAAFGPEEVIGRKRLVMPFESELVDRIVGDAEVRVLEHEELEAALIAAAQSPPLDLRTGRFARRRRIAIERSRVRELLVLAALVPLITLFWSLVQIIKLDSATDHLNAQTLATAEATLGRPVTLETAEAELAQRLGSSAHGGVMPPLTGLSQALQSEEGVSSTEISYRGDGTLATTLAAPDVDSVNRILVALQRNGYRITAVPRQSPDGRSLVDATVRSAP